MGQEEGPHLNLVPTCAKILKVNLDYVECDSVTRHWAQCSQPGGPIKWGGALYCLRFIFVLY